MNPVAARTTGGWRALAALLATACVAYLCGCRDAPAAPPAAFAAAPAPSVDFRDYTLEPVVDEAERNSPKLRLVSAAPIVTEICCALGLRDQIVGRSDYCLHPPGIESVPSIGSLIKVNAEALIDLKPDRVIVAGTSRFQTDRLSGLGLELVSVPDTRLDDLFAAIREIGALAGRARSAQRLCEMLRADVERAFRGAGVPGARVLVTLGALGDPPRPPFAAGPGSFYDDILRRAGRVNVAADVDASFAPLSLEFIVRADPDVILELDDDGRSRPNGDADALSAWAKIAGLSAVEARRVHVAPGGVHYRLGPRLPQTIRAILSLTERTP